MRVKEDLGLHLLVDSQSSDCVEVSRFELDKSPVYISQVWSMSKEQMLVAAGSLYIRLDTNRQWLLNDSFSIPGIHAGSALMGIHDPSTILTEVLSVWMKHHNYRSQDRFEHS